MRVMKSRKLAPWLMAVLGFAVGALVFRTSEDDQRRNSDRYYSSGVHDACRAIANAMTGQRVPPAVLSEFRQKCGDYGL